jgi:hypothetical protein
MIFPTLLVRTLRLRDIKQLTEGHTASKWRNISLNLDVSGSRALLLEDFS